MLAGLMTSQICSGVNSPPSASATVAGCSESQNSRSPAALPSASSNFTSGVNRGWDMGERGLEIGNGRWGRGDRASTDFLSPIPNHHIIDQPSRAEEHCDS